MKSTGFTLVLLTLVLCPLTQALAETRYVSDLLVVTVRSQKGNTYQTLETLVSNSPVEILAEDKTYVKVRTAKGTEGYIRKQYITKKLPKTIQIKRLSNELEQLKQQLNQIEQDSATNQGEAERNRVQVSELGRQLEQSQQELEKVTREYRQLLKSSENVISLNEENTQLIEQNNQLNSELLVLREENQSFHRSNMIQWFLAGAGVFFGGWLIGKISRKKQRGFSRL